VNKPVDNRREMPITARFLWIPAWIAEEPEMAGSGSCAAPAYAVEMVSPLETGTTWGRPQERGSSRETGPSRGYLAPAGGARRRQEPGNWPAGAARPGRVPPSHTWRDPVFLPGRNGVCTDSVCRKTAALAAAMTPGHDRVRARPLAGCRTRWLMGPARHVPACGCANAGRTVTGRRTRARRRRAARTGPG
jgi:hypothetical protein